MRIQRRDFVKLGAAGVAGAANFSQYGCVDNELTVAAAGGGSLQVRIRGLSLLEYQKTAHTLVLRMLDATKFGMPPHMARLSVAAAAVDKDATSLDPTTVGEPGTSRERWFWDLS